VREAEARAGNDKEVMPQAKEKEHQDVEKAPKCTFCNKTSTQIVDGAPSCDDHIELLYENQVEDYTLKHQKDNDWLKP
jgi:hypothetical protein